MHSRVIIGRVAAINRLSIETNGKGIRTLIGLQGCSLDCKYCINPFSKAKIGNERQYSPMELYNKVKIDNLYFLSTHGGITFGGGEPLLQSDFIREFYDLCPKEWNFAVQTSLAVPRKNIESCLHIFDQYIVDIKSLDPKIYKAYTGKEVFLAKENLQWLLNEVGSSKIRVRVPLIPGYADCDKQKETSAELIKMGFDLLDEFEYEV